MERYLVNGIEICNMSGSAQIPYFLKQILRYCMPISCLIRRGSVLSFKCEAMVVMKTKCMETHDIMTYRNHSLYLGTINSEKHYLCTSMSVQSVKQLKNHAAYIPMGEYCKLFLGSKTHINYIHLHYARLYIDYQEELSTRRICMGFPMNCLPTLNLWINGADHEPHMSFECSRVEDTLVNDDSSRSLGSFPRHPTIS